MLTTSTGSFSMAEFLQLRLCVLLSPLVACCNVSAARPPAALNLKPENPCMRLTSTAIDVIGVNPWPGPAFRGMGGGAFGGGRAPRRQLIQCCKNAFVA